MNATFGRQYAEIDAELEKLDEQRRSLMDRRREVVEEEWRILEAAAGDPQKGDLVIFPKKFGDAAQGDVALVTDRFDRAYEAVSVKLSRGGMSVPLTAVMRVNHPDAAALWKEIDEKRDALTRIIHKATMIFSTRI